MSLDFWVELCWALSVLAGAGVLWRLWREGILAAFPMLATFLAWDIVVFAAMQFVHQSTTLYGHVFFASRIVTWIVSVLVALELVSLITRHYPGIASLARWCIRIALVVAISTALLSATIDLNSRPVESPLYQTLQLVDRTISVSVVGFVLAAVLFLLWFPVRLNRNIVAYALAFVVMYAARVVVLLLMNARGSPIFRVANFLEMCVAVTVYTYWFAAFRRGYETGRVVVGHAWDRTKERRLIEQLESINATMMRATKQSKP